MKIFLLLLLLASLVSSTSALQATSLEDDTQDSSPSTTALDADDVFDETHDHTADSADVNIPLEIFKTCKRKKDCPGAWFCVNGRCVHPEMEETRTHGGILSPALFERARRLFY